MPAGRPTDYHPSLCEKVVEHMRSGLSFESFAGAVGCSKQSLYDWANKFPEFMDAKKEGLELCRLFWERLGTAGAAGKVKNFNCAAWIFNMKNRFRDDWRDRQEVEHAFPKPTVIERLDGSNVVAGISDKIEEP